MKTSKKLFLIFVFGLFIITLAACGPEAKKDEPIDETVETDEEKQLKKEKINEDINAAVQTMKTSEFELLFADLGSLHQSELKWETDSLNVVRKGNTAILLPRMGYQEEAAASIKITGKLGGQTVEKTVELSILNENEVELSKVKSVPFSNQTSEFDVANGLLDLYFEENGVTPYVSVEAFITLLDGFVDPTYAISYERSNGVLTMAYHVDGYDLSVEVDANADTIITDDEGVFYAYMYSTSTNYGRNISYMPDDYADSSYQPGTDVVYDLGLYNMDIVEHQGKIMLPFSVVNQLFAGSSYYNVYYNVDNLYGIYGTSQNDSVTTLLRTSSVNYKDMPLEVQINTFNYLAWMLNDFYGLQEIENIPDYSIVLLQNANKLLVSNPSSFESGLFEFINKTLDECHTSYGTPGYYNRITYKGLYLESYSQIGPRQTGFYQSADTIRALITSKWGKQENRKDYWFVDAPKKIVTITLDGFSTVDLNEESTWNGAHISRALKIDNDSIIPTITGSDRYFFYQSSTLDYNAAEVIAKEQTQTSFNNYVTALTTSGWVLDAENANNVYTKTVNSIVYTLKVAFDSDKEVIYVGITDLNIEEVSPLLALANSISELIARDTAISLEFTMESILKESPSVEQVLLDLTYNGGGNVGALYRVVGFITDQPFKATRIDGTTNAAQTSYIQVDSPVCYSNLKWGLITSGVTFSAANSLTTIFMENNLGPIIGTKTGGGASSITPILLPNGTAFTMSSNNIEAFRTGTGTSEDPYIYHSNEYGIQPLVSIPIRSVYDNQKLIEALDTYYN